MSSPCRGGVPSLRRSRTLVALVAAVLLLTLAPPVTASGHDRAVAPTPARHDERPPDPRALPGEDFPSYPARCLLEDNRPVDACRITTYPGRPWLLLWGDSHALMYLAPLTTLAERHRFNLVSMFSGGCPLSVPFPTGADQPTMTCDKHNAATLKYARRLVDSGRRVKIVLGTFWAVYRDAYARLEQEWRTGRPSGLSTYEVHNARLAVERSARLFRAVGRLRASVDVLAQAPVVPTDARRCPAGRRPYLCDLPRTRSLPHEAANERFLADRVRLLRAPVRVIDPAPRVCGPRLCRGRVDGVDTWFDETHLGMRMTRTMQSFFAPTARDLVRPSRR